MNKDKIIDEVIYQIKMDLFFEDTTALAELLSFIPADKLQNYLPEVTE